MFRDSPKIVDKAEEKTAQVKAEVVRALSKLYADFPCVSRYKAVIEYQQNARNHLDEDIAVITAKTYANAQEIVADLQQLKDTGNRRYDMTWLKVHVEGSFLQMLITKLCREFEIEELLVSTKLLK